MLGGRSRGAPEGSDKIRSLPREPVRFCGSFPDADSQHLVRRRRKDSEMPEQSPSRTSTGLASRLGGAWRRERRARPAAGRLTLLGAAALGVSGALAAAHLGLIAQLVGGLALLPLTLAAFLRLLPPPPWTDGQTGGSDDWLGGNGDRPRPPDKPTFDFDWDSFERQFRAYVGEPPLSESGSPPHR